MKNTVDEKNSEFAAPEEVFERYADMVYRLGFVRTKSQYDADDILQEVFLRYMKVWQNMQSPDHIKATILKITVNCSNNLLTSSWFKKTDPLSDTLRAADIPDDGTLAAVLKLPVKYRTAIHLHYYMGYSVEEIAKITSAKPATVKTWLSRGREKLKTTLETEDL